MFITEIFLYFVSAKQKKGITFASKIISGAYDDSLIPEFTRNRQESIYLNYNIKVFKK